jgi:hypothetical protein
VLFSNIYDTELFVPLSSLVLIKAGGEKRKMTMEEHKKEMEKIMAEMKCPKDFECCKLGSNEPSRTRDIGIKSFLECLGEGPQGCKFSLSFGYSWFCRCPLQLHLAKKSIKELQNHIPQ